MLRPERAASPMCSRPRAHPACSCAPEPMEPDGKPVPMAPGDMPEPTGDKPGQVGGRPERGDDRPAGGMPELAGGMPEPGDKPGGDKPAVGACKGWSGPLPSQKSTTKLKPKAKCHLNE